MSSGLEPLRFAFHGVGATIVADDPECRRRAEADFGLFLEEGAAGEARPGEPVVNVRLSVAPPPLHRIPEGLKPFVRTKDAVMYRRGSVRYHDSGGQALVVDDRATGRAEVFSLNRDLLQEKCYLLVMTRVGEALDRRGLHRIHAAGLTWGGRALLCLLPSGGGKTTLTMALLDRGGFRLLSEEVPLVDREGRLHPFPVRMGVVAGTPLAIPPGFLQPIRRARHGPKVLVDTRWYADRIARAAPAGALFVGRRVGPGEEGIVPLSRLAGLGALVRSCVLGEGIPQLLEYLLYFDARDLWRQPPILLSRLRAVLSLVRRSAAYELRLGPDREANAALVARWAGAPAEPERSPA